MKKSLILCVLAALMAASSARIPRPDWRPLSSGALRAGLIAEAGNDSPAAATDNAKACEHVAFTRSIKYGESDRNVLDVAAADATDGSPRPVLLFVAGENFAADDAQSDPAVPLLEQAMCFAARNGMVAVSVSYRLAPAAAWPAGAKDVAAATSWVHQNIDLFGGSAQEIVLIGYAAGAFHVASFLAHKEFQDTDSDVAGVVLVSGIYHAGTDTADGERSYLGTDASKYNDRSAFPGIAGVDVPIVLAWSSADPPRLVAQGEKLKESLCKAGHCPRTALLTNRSSPASVFDLDGSGGNLHDRTRQLLSQIETRGLP
jgi:acetyl esterase/lipase